jgi:hypothetical protein
MNKRPKNLDLNQLAKRIVDEATGEIEPEQEIDEKKKATIESGRHREIKSRNERAKGNTKDADDS